MKRLIVALIAAVVLAGGVQMAQADCGKCGKDGGPKMMDAGKKADKLGVMLDLTDKQKEQVKALVEAKHAKLAPAMEQMKAAHKAAKEEFEAGLGKILNDKQKAKWTAMTEMDGGHGKECNH